MISKAIAAAAGLLLLPAMAAPASHAEPVSPARAPSVVAVNDSTWRTLTSVPAPESAGFGSEFGYSVAVSGNTMVVGARKYLGNTGRVYVFQRTGSTWGADPVAVIDPPAGVTQSQFGESVAIEGNTLVVGAPYLTRNVVDTAAGTVFVYNGGGVSWTLSAQLVQPGSGQIANARFGGAVAIQGSRIAVGARGKYLTDTDDGRKWGAAYVFTGGGAAWDAGVQLVPSWGHKDQEFGAGVAVNGTTVLVGAPGGTGDALADTGRVGVFTLSGSTWTQQADLPSPALAPGSQFGRTVQMDATSAIVSAPTGDAMDNFPNAPVLYGYLGSGSSWSQPQMNTALTTGPFGAFAADAAFVVGSASGNAEIYAGYSSANLGRGGVYIWGPQAPLTTVRNAALTVPAPGPMVNDWSLAMVFGSWSDMTMTVLTQPAHGTLAWTPDGAFTYTPAAGYMGPDSFTYAMTGVILTGSIEGAEQDPTITSGPATVSLTVAPPQSFTLTYAAGPNGTVSGTSPQSVYIGENGTAVTAVPNQGSVFTGWSDGVTTPTRQDKNVQANISVTAHFAQQPLNVLASTNKSKSKFTLSVLTTGCTGPFTFQVQKRYTNSAQIGSDETPTITWRNYGKTHTTKVPSNTKTLNYKKGTYRAVVTGKCGYLDATSNEVKLKK